MKHALMRRKGQVPQLRAIQAIGEPLASKVQQRIETASARSGVPL
jgi:hypothetical protein